MATKRSNMTEMLDTERVELPESAKASSASTTARAARAPRSADDMITMDAATGENLAADVVPLGSPDRKYSFNTLVAAGIIGFVIGRICAR